MKKTALPVNISTGMMGSMNYGLTATSTVSFKDLKKTARISKLKKL